MKERYRVLAIDYGTKRIGLAISDELRMLASARGTIDNSVSTKAELIGLVEREGIRAVVLGMPLTLRNTDSTMTVEVRKFKEKLEGWLRPLGVEILIRDERLTSMMANSHIAQSDLPKHKKENKSLRDEEAARILLQEYLNGS